MRYMFQCVGSYKFSNLFFGYFFQFIYTIFIKKNQWSMSFELYTCARCASAARL